jgi:hypothetical protein
MQQGHDLSYGPKPVRRGAEPFEGICTKVVQAFSFLTGMRYTAEMTGEESFRDMVLGTAVSQELRQSVFLKKAHQSGDIPKMGVLSAAVESWCNPRGELDGHLAVRYSFNRALLYNYRQVYTAVPISLNTVMRDSLSTILKSSRSMIIS